MRKQWDFKKRKEFCGCTLVLLFAVAFAISTMISIATSIATAAPPANDIQVSGGGALVFLQQIQRILTHRRR